MKKMGIVVVFMAAFFLQGCASFFHTFDREEEDTFDHGPVTGGLWSEGNQLSDDDRPSQMASVYGDRSPAGRSNLTNEIPRGGDFVETGEDGSEGAYQAPSVASHPNLPPAVKRNYKNGNRATRADFVDEELYDGSLWGANGQSNYYFSKNKVRSIGDIITVNIESNLVKDTALEIRRTLTEKEREIELDAAKERVAVGSKGANKDQLASSAAAPERKPADEKSGDAEAGSAKKVTLADIDVTPSMGIKEGDTMMAEIIERYPNGNYKIRGTKRVPYRSGYRMVHVVAVARGQDMSDEDVITSGKLYEYRVEAVR